jgi:hypothetical protein
MEEQPRTSTISLIMVIRRHTLTIGIGRKILHVSRLDPSIQENDLESDRKTNMLHYNEYVVGWLDSSIHDFLEVFPRSSKSTAFALITCLDSNLDPTPLLQKSPELRVAINGAKPLKRGLLFPSKRLQEANLRDQIFFGFDEIWFFPSDKIEPKPESAWIVGPGRIDQAKLDRLGPWMTAHHCSLALGDGDGLNVIVRAQGLVKYLIAHSISQPKPSLQRNELWTEDEPVVGTII